MVTHRPRWIILVAFLLTSCLSTPDKTQAHDAQMVQTLYWAMKANPDYVADAEAHNFVTFDRILSDAGYKGRYEFVDAALNLIHNTDGQ
jgi:hypothetical protein